MLENVTSNDKLNFSELSEEEKSKRGILGRLYGPCADIINSTRNKRKYSDKLWEKVFQQPLVEEMFKAGGIPGEIDHPVDRSETDSSRIAIMMPEKPKKGKDGKLMAYFDILDTPCGKIAYQLAKYGFKWGVSSRGEGDIIEDFATGEDKVDPDTYTLNAFDLVLIPSVEQARLTMISESLNNKEKKKSDEFRKLLKESIDSANDKDKEIMVETLKELNIKFIDDALKEENANDTYKKGVDIQEGRVTTADNIEVEEAIRSLQESLKQTQNLQKQVKALREQLSVCNAKEAKLTESLQKSGSENKLLKEELEDVNKRLSEVSKSYDEATETVAEKSKLIEAQNKRIEILTKRCDTQSGKQRELAESISSAKSDANKLNEELLKEREQSKKQVASLKESLNEAKQNLAIKEKELNTKVTRANKIAEGYHQIAIEAVDKYINLKARSLGVSVNSIKSRLGESFSVDDIDDVCSKLANSNLSANELPFEFKNPRKIQVKESVEPIVPKSRFDDEVDEQLVSLAGAYMKK